MGGIFVRKKELTSVRNGSRTEVYVRGKKEISIK